MAGVYSPTSSLWLAWTSYSLGWYLSSPVLQERAPPGGDKLLQPAVCTWRSPHKAEGVCPQLARLSEEVGVDLCPILIDHVSTSTNHMSYDIDDKNRWTEMIMWCHFHKGYVDEDGGFRQTVVFVHCFIILF